MKISFKGQDVPRLPMLTRLQADFKGRDPEDRQSPPPLF